jgi:hypothetical protein
MLSLSGQFMSAPFAMTGVLRAGVRPIRPGVDVVAAGPWTMAIAVFSDVGRVMTGGVVMSGGVVAGASSCRAASLRGRRYGGVVSRRRSGALSSCRGVVVVSGALLPRASSLCRGVVVSGRCRRTVVGARRVPPTTSPAKRPRRKTGSIHDTPRRY